MLHHERNKVINMYDIDFNKRNVLIIRTHKKLLETIFSKFIINGLEVITIVIESK